ncbi:MAG TPA: Stp1/IreP family PP2C-type Ser/Thr phosphatase [Nitrospiraceae bacterium]|nr:Stp1/IreP family PP2C-type Ser/Thr phosphatase [Nitrospiraceae bacterium]
MTMHELPHGAAPWHGVGLTDRGRVRTSNQDAFAILNKCGVWIVADGMGGRAGGDIASRMTVDSLSADLSQRLGTRMSESTELEAQRALLHQVVHMSNQAVREEASRRPELLGMGTTLVILMIMPHPEPTALIAHVGDSRVYCLRSGTLTQVTRDHSFVEESLRDGLLTQAEALNHPLRHMLTRAVGAETEVETEITVYGLAPQDILLLCTDGLTKMLPDRIIRDILSEPAASLLQMCRALIDEANAHGGEDNTTVVLVKNELTTSPQER